MIAAVRCAGLLVLLAAAAQPHPTEAPFAREYRALVDAYRDGSSEKPVEGMLALDADRLHLLVSTLVKYVRSGFSLSLDAGFFQAAAALHLDAAARCWEDERNEAAERQRNLGEMMVNAAEPQDEGPGSFRRRWFASAALLVAANLRAPDALKYFDHAVDAVPGDVPLLTAAGWFSERLADGAAADGQRLRDAQAARRRHQRTAERYLAAAVDVDPRAEEPALRLARVETLMRRDARASGRLLALLARDQLVPFTAYLARLFLADIREREGRHADAERLLREAIALDPVAQSARVALAQLLYAAGDAARAAAAIEPLAAPAAGRTTNDPWSDYQLAYPAVGTMLLEELRDEVQR